MKNYPAKRDQLGLGLFEDTFRDFFRPWFAFDRESDVMKTDISEKDGNYVVEKLDTKFTAKVNKIAKYDTSATTKAVELTVGDTAYKIADVNKDSIEATAIGGDMTAVSYNG